MYPLMSVQPELSTVNCMTGNRVSRTVSHLHSVIVQPTFCTFLIRNIFALSVIHLNNFTRTFVYRSLSVTCSVRMRSLRLQRRSSPPPRQLPSPDKQFLYFFLSVQRPLPVTAPLGTCVYCMYPSMSVRPVLWKVNLRTCTG